MLGVYSLRDDEVTRQQVIAAAVKMLRYDTTPYNSARCDLSDVVR